ncbi:hypothetical protein [Actinomadura rayongensis]|uniref:Vegetative cell wall protein gp1 n=1 Tax=Actinomadura rayongensis TaxID=1429076 RepID=A0A6I4WAG9_9ACTN|nr:hypothetical protein [Actinomadura rayongensis]MXQ67869.1 hypothetical protein [Actinomadura rayongensis]
MTAFLGAIGAKLADRWVTALLGPGLLFLGAVALAARLGQTHALSARRLAHWLDALAAQPAARSTGAVLVAAAGVLIGSAAAGLAATAAGNAVRRLWNLPGRRLPWSLLRAWRRRRWFAADEAVKAAAREYDAAPHSAARHAAPHSAARHAVAARRATDRRDAVCLVEPDRPTWIADRLRAAAERVRTTYGFGLDSAWPHLWSLASEPLRADVAAAQDAYERAALLFGWSLLYLVLAPWWWPALLIAAVTAATAWTKARTAADTVAVLVETTVDLHLRDLADRLGLAAGEPVTARTGALIAARLAKHRPLDA